MTKQTVEYDDDEYDVWWTWKRWRNWTVGVNNFFAKEMKMRVDEDERDCQKKWSNFKISISFVKKPAATPVNSCLLLI